MSKIGLDPSRKESGSGHNNQSDTMQWASPNTTTNGQLWPLGSHSIWLHLQC